MNKSGLSTTLCKVVIPFCFTHSYGTRTGSTVYPLSLVTARPWRDREGFLSLGKILSATPAQAGRGVILIEYKRELNAV